MIMLVTKFKDRVNNLDVNNKTVLNNALGSLIIKGGALIVSLLTMPAYIEYFDNKQVLGLWFTLLSVLSWILTFDFGIGNGLRNRLVDALVKKDTLLIKKYISSTYLIVMIIVTIILLVFVFFFRQIDWNLIFNIPPSIVDETVLENAVLIVFIGIMIQLFLKIITSILYALQKSAIINLLSLFSSVSILIYVLNVNFMEISTNLISLALIHVLAINLPLLIATIIIFKTKLKESKPQLKFFGYKYAKDVILLGGFFFGVQLMYMFITATNELFISWLTSPEMVVEYQIYNKLFTTMGILFTLALSPIWSAVTKALAEKNFLWIKSLYKKLKLIALLGMVLQFLMIPFLQIIINLWLGENSIKVNYYYAIIFALFGSLFIWNGVLSSIANGLGELKFQSIFFAIGAIIKIPIALILVSLLDSWIGIIMANIIALSLYCIIQPFLLDKLLNKSI